MTLWCCLLKDSWGFIDVLLAASLSLNEPHKLEIHTGTSQSCMLSHMERFPQYSSSAKKSIEFCIRMQPGTVERTSYYMSCLKSWVGKTDAINYQLCNLGQITQHLSFSQGPGKYLSCDYFWGLNYIASEKNVNLITLEIACYSPFRILMRRAHTYQMNLSL